MSNVRVCVDVVGGDEKPQVVLDGIEAALAADPDIEVLAAGPAEIVNPLPLPMHVLRPLKHLTLSPWMTIPFAP